MMPEMTGTEMCLQIKNNIDLCHIPVILLTALNSTEQNIEGLSRGADDLIERLEKLFQHLEQLIIVFHKKHRMSLVFRIFSLNKFYGRIPLIYKYRH